MSRAGYSDDYDEHFNLWRGAVYSAISGKRGQKLLRDFIAALDAMPEKKLGYGALTDGDGCMCSLGAVSAFRAVDVSDVKFDDYGFSSGAVKTLCGRLDIADAMAREVMFENDEGNPWSEGVEAPEDRWVRMRAWAVGNLVEPTK